MTIIKTEDGPFLQMHNVDGRGTVKYVPVAELFGRIWDDYVRGHLSDEYVRLMLAEMSLKPTEVFYMMERMQLGKAEYKRGDYNDRSYV
jgi:hypothetical protein